MVEDNKNKLKTLQEWIEWAEYIEHTADYQDESQYDKKLIAVDDLINWLNEFEPKQFQTLALLDKLRNVIK